MGVFKKWREGDGNQSPPKDRGLANNYSYKRFKKYGIPAYCSIFIYILNNTFILNCIITYAIDDSVQLYVWRFKWVIFFLRINRSIIFV